MYVRIELQHLISRDSFSNEPGKWNEFSLCGMLRARVFVCLNACADANVSMCLAYMLPICSISNDMKGGINPNDLRTQGGCNLLVFYVLTAFYQQK